MSQGKTMSWTSLEQCMPLTQPLLWGVLIKTEMNVAGCGPKVSKGLCSGMGGCRRHSFPALYQWEHWEAKSMFQLNFWDCIFWWKRVKFNAFMTRLDEPVVLSVMLWKMPQLLSSLFPVTIGWNRPAPHCIPGPCVIPEWKDFMWSGMSTISHENSNTWIERESSLMYWQIIQHVGWSLLYYWPVYLNWNSWNSYNLFCVSPLCHKSWQGVLHTTGGYMVYTATTFKYAFDYHDNDIYWYFFYHLSWQFTSC